MLPFTGKKLWIILIVEVFQVVPSWSILDTGKGENLGDEKFTYPWVYTTNPCPNNGSVYKRCSTKKNNCNSTVCCLGLVDDMEFGERCINGQNCTFLVKYEYEGPYNLSSPVNNIQNTNSTWIIMHQNSTMRIRVTMTSIRKSPHYFAYALSYNTKMGNDLVFVCELKQNQNVKFYTRWNHQHMNVRAHTNWGRPVAMDISTYYDQNASIAMCQFYLPINLEYIHFWPSWNFTLLKGNSRHDKYYNLLAVGTVQDSGQLKYHHHFYTTGHVNNRWSYTNQCLTTTGYPTYMSEKIHAGYMIGIWLILIPTNTIISRFYKMWPAVPFPVLGPFWLVVHIILSFLSWVMTFAAYAVVTGERNFQVSDVFPAKIHSVLGFSSIASLTLQMFLGLTRACHFHPFPIKIFQSVHALFHIPVLLLGYGTIASAPYTTYNVAPCGIYHSIYAFIILQILFHFLLIKSQRNVDGALDRNVNRVLTQLPLLHDPNETMPQDMHWKRLLVLTCYIISSFGFTALLIFQLLYPDTFGPPCLPGKRSRSRHLR